MQRWRFVLLTLLLATFGGRACAGGTFRYAYRQMVTTFLPADAKPDRGQDLCVNVSCGDLFGKSVIFPAQMLTVNAWWTPLPFGVYRNGRLLDADKPIRPGDRLLLNYRDTWAKTNNLHYGLAAYVFYSGPPALPSAYGTLTPAQVSAALTPDRLSSDSAGLLDWSAPVSLREPASLIQMDSLYSQRWNLYWQFAAPAPGDRRAPAALRDEFPPWLDGPCFPILLNTLTDPGRQGFGHFDFDDIPRFPLLYLDYWRQTGNPHALHMARHGLEAILRYETSQGAMPLAVYPWKRTQTFSTNWLQWTVPHSMRAVARGVGVWKRTDPAFDARLETAYQRFRRFVFAHLDGRGLYRGRLWSNGFVLDAVCRHYQAAHQAQDRKDIRTLADAVCRTTPDDPKARQEFGENLPITVLGLAEAYRALGEPSYRDGALSWLNYPLLPSMRRARRFWQGLPDFQHAASGPDGVPNALCVWYIADALIAMYRATGNQCFLSEASWELGDYYDTGYSSSQRMVSTGDAFTEHWGSDNAEDAMRAFSKYLWSLRYPGRITNAYIPPENDPLVSCLPPPPLPRGVAPLPPQEQGRGEFNVPLPFREGARG